MAKKLTIEEKVEIALAEGTSLRELAKKYEVHHSTIAEIRKEAERLITRHWEKKTVGRPAKKISPELAELENLNKRIKELEKNVALKEMRIDFLELKLKWDDELLAENKITRKSQLKKNKE